MNETKQAEWIGSRVPIEEPCAGIQWKNVAGVCMDVHCSCGEGMHLDCDYPLFVRCKACRQTYMMGFTVALNPVDADAVWPGSKVYTEDDDERTVVAP